MADHDGSTPSRPLAPAPANDEPNGNHGDNHSKGTMSFTCQTCTRRKVKCDKTLPVCSTCRRGRLECVYQAPQPRKRKRRPSGDYKEKLARYEEILHQHGLLQQASSAQSPKPAVTPEARASIKLAEAKDSGRLVTGQDKTRYIDNSLWQNLGEDAVDRLSDDEDEMDDQSVVLDRVPYTSLTSDPLTGALLGVSRDLVDLHPTHLDAMRLWHTHIRNVEPLCKILHIPTLAKVVESVSQQPALASKTDECLLFAIYHFAVISMTEEECLVMTGEPRPVLRSRYHYAARQALINVGFLRTTEMQVLQAYCLFLLATRMQYDPHTYWILTGTAMRISQRMGLHRDGEALGLNPYDVQMRRRLFYQILPLEGYASLTAGVGINMRPDTWDTKQPINVNDTQIWPGMTEPPEPQKGATEMIFCLARAEIGKLHVKTFAFTDSWLGHETITELERSVDEAEASVESKFLRYCDVVNPLHFLVMAIARSATNIIRLRLKLQQLDERTMSDSDRRELCTLSEKMMDMDSAAHSNPGLKGFLWHIGANLVHLPMVYILRAIAKPRVLAPDELSEAWSRLEQVFNNHPEITKFNRSLHIAIGRLTLRSWNANPPVNLAANQYPPFTESTQSEPAFIQALRSNRKTNGSHHANQTVTPDTASHTMSTHNTTPSNDSAVLFGNLDGVGTLGDDFSLDTADWMFWDQLMKDYQNPGDQEGVPSAMHREL